MRRGPDGTGKEPKLREKEQDRARRGVVLIAVLVAVVLLSLVAYQYSDLMTSEYRAAESTVRAAQSRSLAISGVHYAAAALADKTTFTNRLNSNPFDNESVFKGVIVRDDDRAHFQGRFTLIAPPAIDDALSGSTTTKYGVTDESAKINLNALVKQDTTGNTASKILLKLPNMTDEIADAIIDWISDSETPRPNGTKSDYYSGLTPPYRCKNGPLDSIEELLLVKGVTPELLFGSDKNHNGMQDDDENSSNGFDPGWAAYLTTYSRTLNLDSDGKSRMYLGEKLSQDFYTNLKTAVGQPLADYIVLYKAYGAASPVNHEPGDMSAEVQTVLKQSSPPSKPLSSQFDLYSTITLTYQENTGNNRNRQARTFTKRYPSPLSADDQLLVTLLDKTSTSSATELPVAINVLTAPKAVLSCLTALGNANSALSDTDVDSIISSRPVPGTYDPGDPKYQTIAWLKTDIKLSNEQLKVLQTYIASRTQTYRVQSLGYFDQGGPVTRVEAVIDTNNGSPRIIYFRDLTPLGRGFNVPR
ncbi:MAG: general secretion pathway protein GspK [Gemmataceae bacterium]